MNFSTGDQKNVLCTVLMELWSVEMVLLYILPVWFSPGQDPPEFAIVDVQMPNTGISVPCGARASQRGVRAEDRWMWWARIPALKNNWLKRVTLLILTSKIVIFGYSNYSFAFQWKYNSGGQGGGVGNCIKVQVNFGYLTPGIHFNTPGFKN